MEFSMTSPEFWGLFGWLENICAGHTPKTSIFRDLRVKADQLSHSGDMAGQLSCLMVKAIYHIRKAMFFLKVKVDHLTTLAPDTVSSILLSTLLEATSKSMPALFRPALFQNLYKKIKRKCAGNQEEQWLHWPQVRIFYLIVKVGYYPWLSLACASV